MKNTKPLNLKLWTIRIRCLICKPIIIHRTVENLRHNHPSIGTNIRAANSDFENKMLDCAMPWCALYIWWQFILLVSRIAFLILQCRNSRFVFDAWCSICVLKSISCARIYTRNQLLQMVQNNSKKNMDLSNKIPACKWRKQNLWIWNCERFAFVVLSAN